MKYSKEQQKEWMNEQRKKLTSYLSTVAEPRYKDGKQFICPLCGSRSGLSISGTWWKCFSCSPGERGGGDVFQMISLLNGDVKGKELFSLAAKILSELDPTDVPYDKSKSDDSPKSDFSEYITKCKNTMAGSPGMEYMMGRGISEAVCERFSIGYDEEFTFTSQAGKLCKMGNAVVIPNGNDCTSYSVKLLNPPEWFDGSHLKPSGVPSELFNVEALYAKVDTPVFIVESAVDALSFSEIGYDAVATNSVGGSNLLVRKLREKRTERKIIIAFDNDNPGQSASKILVTELCGLGLDVVGVDIFWRYKDANEYLVKNRIGFEYTLENLVG